MVPLHANVGLLFFLPLAFAVMVAGYALIDVVAPEHKRRGSKLAAGLGGTVALIAFVWSAEVLGLDSPLHMLTGLFVSEFGSWAAAYVTYRLRNRSTSEAT